MPLLFLAVVVLGVLLMGKREQKADAASVAAGERVLHLERAAGVHPDVWAALLDWSHNGAFPVMVGKDGGLRTAADQLRLYALGRSETGKIVTNALTPEDSAHGRGGGVDLWPVNADGSVSFDTSEGDGRYQRLASWWQGKGFRSPVYLSNGNIDWAHAELADWRALPYPPPNYNTGV